MNSNRQQSLRSLPAHEGGERPGRVPAGRRIRSTLGGIAGACVGSVLCVMPGSAAELRYAFDTRAVIAAQPGGQMDGRASCPELVPPMTDMSHMFTFYKPDRTQSVVDREAMNRYVARVRPTGELSEVLFNVGDVYVRVPNLRGMAAKCIASQLVHWANAGALLDKLDENDPVGRRQAILVGIWTGVAAANVFAIASSGGALSPSDVEPINTWFSHLSDAIVAEFTPPKQQRPKHLMWLDATFNQSYWAAAAVGSMAVLTQDRSKFAWAMAELRKALANVRGDGSLPHEIGRGGRALHYHSFALEPISLLVAFADANGVRITPAEEANLQRAARFTAAAFSDPHKLAEQVGRPQSRTDEMAAWMDILAGHFRRENSGLAAELEAIAAPLRPFKRDFVGIDVTRMFASR